MHTGSTQAFETARTFLDMVTPSDCLYCGSYIGPASKGWRDEVHNDKNQLIARLFSLSNAGNNTYFALSGFKQGWHEITTASGSVKRQFRTQSNTVRQQSLWLDIDAGKNDSPYPDAQSCLMGVKDFLLHTKLPAPIIVQSGRGLHLYWSFVYSEAVPTAQWRIMAGMLRALCMHFGFIADHSRTCDPASVLRLPGTMNYGKDGVARPVVVLSMNGPYYPHMLAASMLNCIKLHGIQPARPQAPAKPVTPLLPMSPAPQATPFMPAQPAPSAPSGLSFNMAEFDAPPRHPLKIIEGCQQIQRAGVGTYTQWYNMLTVASHCAFGERMAHDISRMDPGRYSYENVQNKFRQAVDGGYGPCRCSVFDEKDPGICPSCPHWGKITSPIVLGEFYIKQAPVKIEVSPAKTSSVISVGPSPFDALPSQTVEVIPFKTNEFAVIPGKGIYQFTQDAEKGVVSNRIADYELYIHSIEVDATQPDVERTYLIRKVVPGRAAAIDLRFPISDAFGSTKIQAWLGNNALLPCKPCYNKAISDFMSTYLASIQNKLPELFVHDKFGWTKQVDKVTGETSESFVIGDTAYSAAGVSKVRLNERAADVAKSFEQKGDLEKWKEVPRMYRKLGQHYPMLMMLASFGAPFMRMGAGTAQNVVYSLWDTKGGKGKSTVLEAAASVWGNPKTLLQSKSDTPASRFQKCAVHQNLPIPIDEVTMLTQEELASLIYDLVNGREKSRSTSSGTGLAKSGTWATTTLMTSNRSLYEVLRAFRVQSDATSMRVIEMQCDFQDYSGTETYRYITGVQDTMLENYGLAGPAFIQWLFQNPKWFKLIPEAARQWVNENIKNSDERFWMYGIAIPLMSGAAAKVAGLVDYDIQALMKWVIDVLLPTLRSTVKQKQPSGSNLLADYLNEHLRSMLTVASEERRHNQPDTGTMDGTDSYVKRYPLDSLYIRYEMDTDICYVNARHLTAWCAKNGLSIQTMLAELARKGQFEMGDKFQYSLGRNVRCLDKSKSMVYKFYVES